MADETLSGANGRSERPAERARKPGRPAPSPRQAGGTPFTVYKPGQGAHIRWGTAAGAGVIALAGARFAHEWLRVPFGNQLVIRTLIPVVLLVVLGYLVYWVVGRRRGTVDFMIATEGEMKKVNWSSRKEVLGATKVVIFTVLALGFMLAAVDFCFMVMFSTIGVLKIPFWEGILGDGSSP